MIRTGPWGSLVDSVRRRRAPDARFFKPLCLIAAIDLADEGCLDPESLDGEAIVARFQQYVAMFYPDRAKLGWRPLWHLSNDALWTFSARGHPIVPEDFGADRKPGTRAILFARFDRLAINENLLPYWQSQDSRSELRTAMLSMLADDDESCRRFLRPLSNPDYRDRPDFWPTEAEVLASLRSTRDQPDLFGESTGVEMDDADDYGEIDHPFDHPFDPESIDVVTRNPAIDTLLSRVKAGMIDLQPEFQRKSGIWDAKRQSRLIESLLLRIPLPVLYAAENDDGGWEIVDGIQRLTTIARFMSPEVISETPLILSDLQYLPFEGRGFHDLSDRLKFRLRETELVIHLIRKGTPVDVRFNIFARINTGGVELSAQELRHAITPGPARELLKRWAESPVFLEATDKSVKPTRMDDRELILRFIGFLDLGTVSYNRPDMDGFLVQAMRAINRLTPPETDLLWERFVSAMNTARAIFGNDAFRKRYDPDVDRLPINKALFEAVSVGLAVLTPPQQARLVARQAEVRAGFMALCRDRSFEMSISQGTGGVSKVKRRFAGVSDLFRSVLSDD